MKVIYKGLECKLIYGYQNGNYEILCLNNVILVNEREIKKLK